MKKKLDELTENSVDENKLKKLFEEMKEFSKKMEALKELERKVTKVFRDLDVNSLRKQINQKAETEEIQKDFSIFDTKINTNTEAIGYLRKDLDNLLILYKKLIQSYQNQTPD
jgi:hypothetical protein